jgi:predicted nucleic acid-binding protein
VVDTNVVVAGISGFRNQYVPGRIPSADLLHRWADEEHFVWLYSEDIVAEYKEVLKRLHVRPGAIGALIHLIRNRVDSSSDELYS